MNNRAYERWVCVWPTLAVILAGTRMTPLAVPAMLVLLCYLPGRVVARAGGLGRRWDVAGRGVLHVALSLTVMPVVLNPIWHATNDPWVLLGVVWLLLQLGNWTVCRAGRGTQTADDALRPPLRLIERNSTKWVMGAIAVLVVWATVGPYWPTEVGGRPGPSLIHDFVKHHAVLFSLEQRALPLGNAFYADGESGPVYYYHFFYLVPATVRAVCGGLSIGAAFGIHSALVGLATAAMVYLITKRFTGGDGPATLAALLTTAVGALDVIPLALLRQPTITLDAWADHLVRIHNFLNQMIWSPQNVLGVLVALVGVYVWSVKGWWKGWFVLGPVLGAAVVGSSVWVAMVMLAGLVTFVLIEVCVRRAPARLAVRRLAAAALVALLMLTLCAPSVLGYLEMTGRHGKGLTLAWPHQRYALLGRLAPPGVFANLLDLPWVLAIELGPLVLFPLLLPRKIWKRAWGDPGLRLLMVSAVIAVAGFVTLRSSFAYNDFGQKVMMVAMVCGAVLAGCVIFPTPSRPALLNPLGWSLHGSASGRGRSLTGWFVGLMLLAGLPVALYEAPVTVVRRFLDPSGPLRLLVPPRARLAGSEADAYAFLRDDLPADAVIQTHWTSDRVNLVQIAHKQMGVTVLEQDTMVFYPADTDGHARCFQEVSACLAEPGPASACRDTLRRHGITHVFVGLVEHQHWHGLDKLREPEYFDTVFDREGIQVVAVK